MSPTRATAVKFLQASPENPFVTKPGAHSDEEEEYVSRYDSARQYMFVGSDQKVNDQKVNP